MSEITGLLGNDNNKKYFSEALSLGKLSHAFIVNGPEGSGKSVFVRNISAGLLCPADGISSCGKCPSCKKVITGNHPDIIYVTHEKDSSITVDEIRGQVIDTVSTTPYYGPYKIYIINDAELMTVSAQNALLKTIEEPPSYGMIFLLTSTADGLLETIRSRCIKLNMEMLPDETVTRVLTENFSVPEEKALDIAAFARGNLGFAIGLSEGTGGISELKERIPRLFSSLASMDAFEIDTEAKELDKLNADDVLMVSRLWFHDVLVSRAAEGFRLYFPGESACLEEQARALSYEALNDIFDHIDETEKQLYFNVKSAAAFEGLLLKIRAVLQAAK